MKGNLRTGRGEVVVWHGPEAYVTAAVPCRGRAVETWEPKAREFHGGGLELSLLLLLLYGEGLMTSHGGLTFDDALGGVVGRRVWPPGPWV